MAHKTLSFSSPRTEVLYLRHCLKRECILKHACKLGPAVFIAQSQGGHFLSFLLCPDGDNHRPQRRLKDQDGIWG